MLKVVLEVAPPEPVALMVTVALLLEEVVLAEAVIEPPLVVSQSTLSESVNEALPVIGEVEPEV